MKPTRKARPSEIVLAFVAVSVIWGSTYYGIRVALESFPPFLLGALRFVFAGALLYGVLRVRGEEPPTPVEWGGAALTGVLFFVIGNGLVNLAEQSLSSGLASVLVATMPLWATLFERFVGGRVTRREWAGIALGLTGVAVLNLGSDLRASGWGAVFGLAAPMGWALGSIGTKRLPLPCGAMRTASQMLAGGLAMLLVGIVRGEHLPSSPPARSVLAVAYLAVFGSLVGFTAYAFLLRHTRAAVATSYAYVNPVIAVALGAALGGERLVVTSAVGTAVTLGAVLMLTGAKTRRQSSAGALYLQAVVTGPGRSSSRSPWRPKSEAVPAAPSTE
jgi:drug/metabolite transporter (DMT)-like permease